MILLWHVKESRAQEQNASRQGNTCESIGQSVSGESNMDRDFILYIAILIISVSGFAYLSQPMIDDIDKPIKQTTAGYTEFDVIATLRNETHTVYLGKSQSIVTAQNNEVHIKITNRT